MDSLPIAEELQALQCRRRQSNSPAVGLGSAAVIGGVLTGAFLYDLSRAIADAIPVPTTSNGGEITVFHYTTAGPASFVNGLLPGGSATDHPFLTAESASVGLGIPPPSLVYPVNSIRGLRPTE